MRFAAAPGVIDSAQMHPCCNRVGGDARKNLRESASVPSRCGEHPERKDAPDRRRRNPRTRAAGARRPTRSAAEDRVGDREDREARQ